MEKQIEVKSQYNNLEKILDYAKKECSYDCSIDYDIWELRTDENNQAKKCVIIKKSGMHAVKLYFNQENVMKATYIIPNKIMNVYFGKSQKAYRSIPEIIGGAIKNVLLAGSQKKAFNQIEQTLAGIKI
jgi:hypothetical protein